MIYDRLLIARDRREWKLLRDAHRVFEWQPFVTVQHALAVKSAM